MNSLGLERRYFRLIPSSHWVVYGVLRVLSILVVGFSVKRANFTAEGRKGFFL